VTAVRVTVQIALFGAALADSQQTQAGAQLGGSGVFATSPAMIVLCRSGRHTPISRAPAGVDWREHPNAGHLRYQPASHLPECTGRP
jgi:hypothetical protein